jgi:trans-2,3-dihydro-3-hydroxyanthranilate isomerase
VVSTGLPFHIVPVGSLAAMRALRPNPGRLLQLGEQLGVSDICAFSFETSEPDATVHARMFAPSYGIPEDPATGSAAGCLGSYVVKNRAVPSASLTRLIVEQGLEMGRPARIHVEVHSDGGRICSVLVGGCAVVVGEGSIYDPAST